MFQPSEDLKSVWSRLRNDSPILNLLDLAEADNLTILQQIIKRNQWDDLASGDKRLNIYFCPSRRSRMDIVTQEVLQVDCHVPAKQDTTAWEVLERSVYLLNNYQVNGRIFYFDGQLGELPTMRGFFCAGARFNYYAIK